MKDDQKTLFLNGTIARHLALTGAGSIDETSILGWILATIPTFTCLLLFLSPLPSIKHIIKDKSTKTLPALPFVSMFVQCLFWTTYGILVQSFTVFVPNFCGILLALYYTAVFHKYANDLHSLYQLYLIAFFSLFGFGFLLIFSTDRTSSVGILSLCSTILFIFSPLIMIFQVCRDRSVASMPFHLSFLTFCNASVWILFGWFVRDDYTIWLPNTFGFISGSLQLICHSLFGDIKQNLSKMGNSMSFSANSIHGKQQLEQFDPFDGFDFESESESIVLT